MASSTLAHRLSWIALGIVMAFVFGFMGWALFATRQFGPFTGGSMTVIVLIAFGVLGTGGLTGALMWLAFYSARMDYDDRAAERFEEPPL